jgi:hypothetical protein
MDHEQTNGTPVMEGDAHVDDGDSRVHEGDSHVHAGSERFVDVDLTLTEAEALKSWAIKPAKDGSLAIDDAAVKPALVKLGRAIDYARAVSAVRDTLEGAGLYTDGLSDSEVADLGRQISNASLHRAG